MRWTGQQAIVALPEHVDVSNAGQIAGELLSVIHRGAKVLIADMTTTISCDHAGADALVRAYQRGVLGGTRLRLAVTARVVRRVLRLSGLDRLVSVYPSLEAAIAAGRAGPGPGGQAPPHDGAARAVRPGEAAAPDGQAAGTIMLAVLRDLADALPDGVALAGNDGLLALASSRLEEMFGYQHAELPGRPVESLIPASLQAAHRRHRAAWEQAPAARAMGRRQRLTGLRKDGTTFPVEISLSPLPAATGSLTFAVIRDVTAARRLDHLAGAARAAVAAEHEELLGKITSSLFRVGLGLQAATSQPGIASRSIDQALRHL